MAYVRVFANKRLVLTPPARRNISIRVRHKCSGGGVSVFLPVRARMGQHKRGVSIPTSLKFSV